MGWHLRAVARLSHTLASLGEDIPMAMVTLLWNVTETGLVLQVTKSTCHTRPTNLTPDYHTGAVTKVHSTHNYVPL